MESFKAQACTEVLAEQPPGESPQACSGEFAHISASLKCHCANGEQTERITGVCRVTGYNITRVRDV